MNGFLTELALEALHAGIDLGTRYLRGALESRRRARETPDETAARHYAEDQEYQAWLARVRAARGEPTRT